MKYKIVNLFTSKYQTNKALAVAAKLEYDDGYEENVIVSKNLDHADNNHASKLLAEGEFYGDINNHQPIIDQLVKLGKIEPVGKCHMAGYVNYPVYKVVNETTKST